MKLSIETCFGNKYTFHDVEKIEQEDGYFSFYIKPGKGGCCVVHQETIKNFTIEEDK